MDDLVSCSWLSEHLGEGRVRILDATLFLPGAGRDPRAEYEAAHIPGALFMDLDGLVDPDDPLPHSLPPAALFAARMAALGVSNEDEVVVYDNSPLHSAARAWWMLKAFGAHNVAVLDGGLQKWAADGRPLESGVSKPTAGGFDAMFDAARFADKHGVSAILHSDLHEIVDARSYARFAGEEPEPRPGVAPGHIPGSKSLPQSLLFDTDNSFKQLAALRAAFDTAGVDLSKPMITTCGSGVTAAVIGFAAHLLGAHDVKLYDGSWSEWGADPATPKAIGRE